MAREPFTIVIDPGHGGNDAGAVDNNAKEKDINLGVALKLSDLLKKELKNDVKVVMTRDDDTFISLQKRADIANQAKGDLFISIHTNSVDKNNPNRKIVQGTSVYALGLHKDKDNMRVAQRENSVIELEKNYKQKYSGFDPSKDESYIIFEMAQKKNLEQSLKFANEAQKQLVSKADRSNRGVKQAGFWVLWATSMPSVLVELDFICNPETAKFMASDSGQLKFAEALSLAVKNYIKNTSGSSLSFQTETNDKSDKIKELKVVKEEVKDILPRENSRKSSLNSEKRRRRSVSGKNRNKDVASADIALNNIEIESEQEETGNSIEEQFIEQPSDAAIDKKKKDKKGKKKEIKETKSGYRNYNSRRILVDGNGKVLEVVDIDRDGKVKSTSKNRTHKTKKEKLHNVYKIQILASTELLSQNNPRFCGLSPISSFKERNLYKYTVGESSDKEEIEKLLEEVKKKIPDAFIIVSSI